MTFTDAVRAARARLVAAGIEPNESALDAELLAREVLGWDRARFLAHETDAPPPSFAEAFAALVARRERREPISGILGRREFWGLDFDVTPDVLAPRPETEIIVEEALARLPRRDAGTGHAPADLRLADVGTGSGCLAVCLAIAREDARVIATDVSAGAAQVARRNAERHGVADRIDIRVASLLEGVAAPLDLIVSNPPYVPTSDIQGLPPEVRDHEPRSALDGGPDGLDLVRALMAQAAVTLSPAGFLIVEFGVGQEAGVREAARRAGLEVLVIRKDLQGIPRTIVARSR